MRWYESTESYSRLHLCGNGCSSWWHYVHLCLMSDANACVTNALRWGLGQSVMSRFIHWKWTEQTTPNNTEQKLQPAALQTLWQCAVLYKFTFAIPYHTRWHQYKQEAQLRQRERTSAVTTRCSRSFKVSDFGTNRKPICDFLIVINTNLYPSLAPFPSYCRLLVRLAL